LCGVLSGSPSSTDLTKLQERDSEDSAAEEEFEVDPSLASLCLLGVVSALLALTIIFEKAQDVVIEKAGNELKPILNSLFSELTVLGFISLVTFCISKFVFIGPVVGSILEQVHFLLFGIMILYICLVMYLLTLGSYAVSNWEHKNAVSQEYDIGKELYKKVEEEIAAHKKCTRWLPLHWKSRSLQQLRFYSLRKEFLLNRQIQQPYEPQKPLPADFDYGRYLASCYGKAFASIVQIKPGVWIVVWALTAIMVMALILFKANFRNFAWAFSTLNLGNVFVEMMVDAKLERILVMNLNLGDFPDEVVSNYLKADRKIKPDKPLWIESQPKTDFLAYLTCQWRKPIQKQESIYWGGAKGENFLLQLFSFSLLFTAISLSLTCGFLIRLVYEEGGSVLWTVAYSCYALVPTLVNVLLNQGATARHGVHAISIGPFRKQKAVATIIREQKTKRAINAMVLVNNMALYFEKTGYLPHTESASSNSSAEGEDMEDTSSIKSSGHKFITMRSMRRMPTVRWQDYGAWKHKLSQEDKLQVEIAEDIFYHFDHDHSGEVDKEELTEMLKYMGVQVSNEQSAAIIQSLDRDGDGVISKEEFVRWHITYISKHHKQDIKTLATKLFARFDKHNKKEISVAEFKEGLTSINAQLTDEEVDDLVRELDENNDHRINLDEFVTLLQKYSE